VAAGELATTSANGVYVACTLSGACTTVISTVAVVGTGGCAYEYAAGDPSCIGIMASGPGGALDLSEEMLAAVKGVRISRATGLSATEIADIGNGANSETTTLYRAVGPDEYQDIQDTGQFRPNPNGDGFQFGKQFGNDLDETIDFADQYPDIGGVVQVEVPNSFLDGIDVGPQVDTGVFPSGTVTIDIDDLDAFNGCISGVYDALD